MASNPKEPRRTHKYGDCDYCSGPAASPLPAEAPQMFTCTCGLGRGPYDPNHGVDCEFRQMRGNAATPSAAEPQKEE